MPDCRTATDGATPTADPNLMCGGPGLIATPPAVLESVATTLSQHLVSIRVNICQQLTQSSAVSRRSLRARRRALTVPTTSRNDLDGHAGDHEPPRSRGHGPPCPSCQQPTRLVLARRSWGHRCITDGCRGEHLLGNDPDLVVATLTGPNSWLARVDASGLTRPDDKRPARHECAARARCGRRRSVPLPYTPISATILPLSAAAWSA